MTESVRVAKSAAKRMDRSVAKPSAVAGRFRSLLESAPDAMVVVDQAGKIVFVNTQTEALFGYPRQELLGRDTELLVPESFREQYRLHRTHFVVQQGVRPMKVQLQLFGLRKDGTEFPAEVRLSPTRTRGGVLVTSAIRDATERKTAEESGRRLAAIVESSEDAIFSTNQEGVITRWSAGAVHIFGYREEDAVGQPICILIPPELRDQEKQILEKLRAGGSKERLETIRVTKEGKRVNVSLTIFPIEDSIGRIVGFSRIARDITERKLTEEALRESETRFLLAAQAGNIYSVEWDLTTDEVVRSSEHCKVLGVSQPRCTHQQSMTRIHPDDREKIASAIARLTPENPTGNLVYRALATDGAVVWLRGSGRAIFDGEGKMLRLIGTVTDITDLKRAEHAVVEMTCKLVDALEQERARIARELHDDIGQRLVLLAVGLDQVRADRDKLPSAARRRIGELRKKVDEVSVDVQALAHDLHPSKLEHLGVVGGIRSWCKEFAKRHKIQVEFRTCVSTDPPLDVGLSLFRVLQEALHNAVKHGRASSVHVELEEISNGLQFVVSDSGTGFDVETALRGKGLGLSSMRERVRLANGTILIESKPMSGTTIRVRVPVEPEYASQP